MTKVVPRNVQSKLTCIYPIRFRALAHEADLFSSDAGSSTLVIDEIYVFLEEACLVLSLETDSEQLYADERSSHLVL